MTDETADDKLSLEELAKKEEASRAQLIDELNDLRALIKSAGWMAFEAICDAQALRRREQLLLDPLFKKEGHPMKAVMESEFTKGEYEGIKAMLTYPHVRIAVIEEELEILREMEPDNDESS